MASKGRSTVQPPGASAPDKAALLPALRRAAALHRAGRLEEAGAAYQAVLALAPGIPEAHHNLGLIHKATGDPGRAEAAFRRALDLAPGYALAHRSLATTLAQQGRHRDALEHACEAARREPDVAAHRQTLAALLPYGRPALTGPEGRAVLERCFRDEAIGHQLLVPATLDLLRRDPAMAPLLSGAHERGAIAGDALSTCSRDSLLHLLLARAIVADETFEELLTLLRRQALALCTATDDRPAPGDARLDFAAALACQCFLVDYACAESAEETTAVETLAQSVAAAPPGQAPWTELVALGLYRPLAEREESARFAAAEAPTAAALALFQRRLLREPVEEARLAATIPAITAVSDTVSAAVQRQYEEHPYPRWLTTRARPARPLAQVIAGLFPQVAPLPPADRPVSILVAGCGTGKHAVDVATRYSKAEVLAVDLSRRSLAYGLRQAEERGLTNLTFAQADILALGNLEQRFDLIESVGVLHHLADPLAGWRVLVGLLEPGGFMRIGLYSRHGREPIEAARRFVVEAGFAAEPAALRAARRAILALPQDHPARRVAGELDFYSLTGCRDLLFNVQERSYSLPELRAALDALGLRFLGFEHHDPAVATAYAKRFPDDHGKTDLANWEAFEADRPTTFGRMYQFWCRRD